MRRAVWTIAALAVACPVAFAQDEEPRTGPSVIKLPVEGVVAQLTFEDGTKISVSSKPTPLKPGTYWLKAMSLFKKDDKGRTWELRSTGHFGSLANVTIDEGQEKVILLGKPTGLDAVGWFDKKAPGTVRIEVAGVGMSGERYFPGAFLEGRPFTPPTVTVKDPDGKVLATSPVAMQKENFGRFEWHYPFGFKGAYKIEVQAVMGPFEHKVSSEPQPVE